MKQEQPASPAPDILCRPAARAVLVPTLTVEFMEYRAQGEIGALRADIPVAMPGDAADLQGASGTADIALAGGTPRPASEAGGGSEFRATSAAGAATPHQQHFPSEVLRQADFVTRTTARRIRRHDQIDD